MKEESRGFPFLLVYRVQKIDKIILLGQSNLLKNNKNLLTTIYLLKTPQEGLNIHVS